MSSLGALHKVLKDETRRKVILILNGKGSLTYTELLESLKVVSTGLLNYHLKVLSELVTKNSNGHYVLTEKGKLASKLLLEFPQESTLLKLRKWERRFWKGTVLILFFFSLISIAAYFLDYIPLNALYLSLVFAVPAICVIYVFEHFMRDVVSEKFREKYLLINYYSRGIVLGFLMWWGIIFILWLTGFSQQISELGQGQILLIIVILVICLWIGTNLNKRQMKKPEPTAKDIR